MVSHPDSECTAQSVVVVTENLTVPATAIVSESLALTCNIPTVTLNGHTDMQRATFSWTGPDGFTSDQQHIEVASAGEYTLIVTNPSTGCTASDMVTVTNNISTLDANIYVSGPAVVNCSSTLTLWGSANMEGAIFSWTGPDNFTATTASVEVSLPGIYSLTVTDTGTGCTSTDRIEVIDGRAYAVINAGPDKV